MKKEYLGDSVYVSPGLEGGICLTTENGIPDDPSNIIHIEPEVLVALVDYIERLALELTRGVSCQVQDQ